MACRDRQAIAFSDPVRKLAKHFTKQSALASSLPDIEVSDHVIRLVQAVGLDLSARFSGWCRRGGSRPDLLCAGVRRGRSTLSLRERHPLRCLSLCRALSDAPELAGLEDRRG